MAQYKYEAIDQGGAEINGTINAPNLQEATKTILDWKCRIIDITKIRSIYKNVWYFIARLTIIIGTLCVLGGMSASTTNGDVHNIGLIGGAIRLCIGGSAAVMGGFLALIYMRLKAEKD